MFPKAWLLQQFQYETHLSLTSTLANFKMYVGIKLYQLHFDCTKQDQKKFLLRSTNPHLPLSIKVLNSCP